MTQKSFILVAAAVAAMILGAVAAYAYDSSRDDLIADGITIAGTDVGGMRADEDRNVKAPTKVTHPKVTRDQLADRYPQLIVVNRSGFELRYHRRLRLVKS